MQQTSFIDRSKALYRYRFQGTVFAEREGYMASSDIGVTFRLNFPQNWGDVHVGFYNGEGYSRPEVNNQKAFMARVGFRPLHTHRDPAELARPGLLDPRQLHEERAAQPDGLQHDLRAPLHQHGLRLPLVTKDKVSSALTNGVDRYPTLEGNGWSIWLTPEEAVPERILYRSVDPVRPHETGRHGQRDGNHLAGRPQRADDRRRGVLVPEAGQRLGRAPRSTTSR